MKHCMIDLETFATGQNAAIVSIGAVAFDPWKPWGADGPGLSDTFHRGLDVDAQVRAGARIDGSTVLWWLGQGEEARAALVDVEKMKPRGVLEAFADWWRKRHCEFPWGNGSTFDLRILREAYELHDLPVPWKFWAERDLRTLKHLHEDWTTFPLKIKREGTHHDALEDAIYQARMVHRAYRTQRDPLA